MGDGVDIKGGWSRLAVRSTGFISVLALLGVLLLGSASSASALPVFNGSTSFPAIRGSSDPEEYSWEVLLQAGQELKSIDDQHAVVYFEDGHPMSTISAGSAHDADGTTVPTSLSVSGANVITLTVHHRAGDPAAGGAPFDYPVNPGPGWEGGFSTVTVIVPSDDQQLREAPAGCRVPGLKGASLKASRKRLDKAGCKLGKVRWQRSRTAKVVKQDVAPGRLLPTGTTISVKLGG